MSMTEYGLTFNIDAQESVRWVYDWCDKIAAKCLRDIFPAVILFQFRQVVLCIYIRCRVYGNLCSYHAYKNRFNWRKWRVFRKQGYIQAMLILQSAEYQDVLRNSHFRSRGISLRHPARIHLRHPARIHLEMDSGNGFSENLWIFFLEIVCCTIYLTRIYYSQIQCWIWESILGKILANPSRFW